MLNRQNIKNGSTISLQYFFFYLPFLFFSLYPRLPSSTLHNWSVTPVVALAPSFSSSGDISEQVTLSLAHFASQPHCHIVEPDEWGWSDEMDVELANLTSDLSGSGRWTC